MPPNTPEPTVCLWVAGVVYLGQVAGHDGFTHVGWTGVCVIVLQADQ